MPVNSPQILQETQCPETVVQKETLMLLNLTMRWMNLQKKEELKFVVFVASQEKDINALGLKNEYTVSLLDFAL